MQREGEAHSEAFTPCTSAPQTAEWVLLILLLALAAFLRLYRLRDVPPGIHNDEIINAQIVDSLRAGAPLSPFYDAGTGQREGLFYLLLIVSRALTDQVPYWFRLPSVACSLLTIFLVYRWSRRRFGPWTALVAAGGLTATFWPVYLGREAIRSGLVPLLGSGMALALWRGLEYHSCSKRAWGWFTLAGFLLGLLQYTYPAARVAPLVIVLFVGYLALFHRDRLKALWRGLALMLIVGAVVAAPAVIYIGTHWGQQHRLMELRGPLDALLGGDPLPVLSSVVRTLGMFVWRGDPQPHYNLPGRPVFGPVGASLFLGGVLIALLNLRRPANAYLLLWTLVLMIPGMVTQPAPHFSRNAGVLATTFVFPGLAVRWLADASGISRLTRASQSRGRIVLAAALILLLGVNVGLTFRDYLHRWPQIDGVRDFRHAGLAEVARHLDRVPDATPMAACTPFLNERHFFWRTDRQAWPYLLNRDDLNVGWYDCEHSQLFPQGGRASRYMFEGDLDFAPFVPLEWIGGAETEIASERSRLMRLDVEERLSTWLDELARPAGVSSPIFEDRIAFLGYRLQPTMPDPGSKVEVLTAWRALDELPADLVIFLHLLDGDGALVAQDDALDALPDTFQPRDVFVQRHVIELASDMPPGNYRLTTGLYVRDGGRFSLASGEGDVLTLEILEVGHVDN